jgi:hypothetical protein
MVLGDWQKLWGTLDKDGNGTLDQSEIEVLLQRMGKEIPIEEMMKQIDTDGDGTIDKAEFSEWFRANPNSNLAVGCGRIVDVVFRGGSILVESGNWQLEGVKVLGAATHGVVAANQCALTLDHSTVADCGGRGLLISDDAHVKMDGCELLGNYMGGICCGEQTELVAHRCKIVHAYPVAVPALRPFSPTIHLSGTPGSEKKRPPLYTGSQSMPNMTDHAAASRPSSRGLERKGSSSKLEGPLRLEPLLDTEAEEGEEEAEEDGDEPGGSALDPFLGMPEEDDAEYGHGVLAFGGARVELTDSVLMGLHGSGLVLADETECKLAHCEVNDCREEGIFACGSCKLHCVETTVAGAQTGLMLVDTAVATLVNVIVSECVGNGMLAAGASSLSAEGCQIHGNGGNGVRAVAAAELRLTGSTIGNNGHGAAAIDFASAAACKLVVRRAALSPRRATTLNSSTPSPPSRRRTAFRRRSQPRRATSARRRRARPPQKTRDPRRSWR